VENKNFFLSGRCCNKKLACISLKNCLHILHEVHKLKADWWCTCPAACLFYQTTELIFQVEVSWIVFRKFAASIFKCGGSKFLRNVCILPQHCMTSQPEDRGSVVLRNIVMLPQHCMESQPESEGSVVLRKVGILPHTIRRNNLKMETAWSSETLVSYHKLPVVTNQKTWTLIFTAVKTPNFAWTDFHFMFCLVIYTKICEVNLILILVSTFMPIPSVVQSWRLGSWTARTLGLLVRISCETLVYYPCFIVLCCSV